MNLNSIKRNSNNFSFAFSIGTLVNNRKFKEGCDDYFSNKDTEKAFIWDALHAIGDDFGEVIYENVLNYIDNIANINTCKLKPLTSIARILGITEFGILKDIDTIPLEILNILDILSINKNYLLKTNIADKNLKELILNYAPPEISSDISLGASIDKDLENISVNENIEMFSVNDMATMLYSVIERLKSSKSKIKYFIKDNYTVAKTINELKNQFINFSSDIFEYCLEDKTIIIDFTKIPDDISTKDLFKKINKFIIQIKKNTYLNNIIEDTALSNFTILSYSDSKKYRYFIYDVFYTALESNLFKTYGSPGTALEHDIILNNISGDIYTSRMTDWNIGLKETISRLMSKYNVNSKFNYFNIANNINSGRDSIDNYSYGEQCILSTELDARKKTKFTRDSINSGYKDSEKIYTRYSYYKEEKVKEIFRFIEKLNINSDSLSAGVDRYINAKYTDIYDINNNYSVLNESQKTDTSLLLKDIIETNKRNSNLISNIDFLNKSLYDRKESMRYPMIKSAANTLTDLAFALIGIREQLKTQSQRNFMTGTSLLMIYIINEYLKKNLSLQYPALSAILYQPEYSPKKLGGSGFGTEIIEYYDTTEYYNISSLVDTNMKNKNYVNEKYWIDDENFSSIGGKTLIKKDVENFYLNTLNVKTAIHKNNDVYDFLNTVYALGSNKSYIKESKANEPISVMLPYEIDNISADGVHYTEEYIDRLSAYQLNMFLKYHGNDIGFYPWYNHKNITHPTVQVHPYLFKFVEYSYSSYPIHNAFNNDANENLIHILTSNKLSTVLGEYGNILNIWSNNTLDYSGYRSRYEDSDHALASNLGYASPVTNYDGTFYPPALDEYVIASKNEYLFNQLLSSVEYQIDFINNKPTFYNKYYSHLDLSEEISKHIARQLKIYKNEIMQLANQSLIIDSQYDIYKYCLDKYFNSLILYKYYSLNASYNEKQNAKGWLWIRYNNHPIGFPAFDGPLPQVSLKYNNYYLNEIVNSSIGFSSKHKPSTIHNTTVGFDFTTDYNDIYLNSLSQYYNDNDISVIITSNRCGYNISSSMIVYDMDIEENKNNIVFSFEDYRLSANPNDRIYKNSTILYCTPNEYISSKEMTYIFDKVKNGIARPIRNSEYDFKGFFHADKELYSVFLKVDYELDRFKLRVFASSENKLLGTYKKYDSRWMYFKEFYNSKTIIKDIPISIGYTNNLFTLVFLTKMDDSINARTYVGENVKDKSKKCGVVNYLASHNELSGEYNSADRFSAYITTIDFNELYLLDKSMYHGYAKYYNLNSDISYIPLYAGRQSLIRLWNTINPDDYVSDRNSNSIELLGLSYNNIKKDIEQKEKYIMYDGLSTLTDLDITNILNATIRVFEHCDRSAYLFLMYNRALRPQLSLTFDFDERYYKTRIKRYTLKDYISSDNCLSDYMVLLYNSEAGAKYPLIAGPLSPETFNDDNIYYISADSPIDEFIKDNGFRPKSFINVVGTTTFKSDLSNIIDCSNTNHLLNIKKVSAVLSSINIDDTRKRYYVDIKLYQNKTPNDFVINTGALELYVYKKNSLGQFKDYHYLEPFDLWPFNSIYTVSSNVFGEEALTKAKVFGARRSLTSKEMSAIQLEGLSSFDQVPEISSNQITFKTSEEDTIGPYDKYPPTVLDEILYDKFNSINKSNKEAYNTAFSLSNTYVLELDSPKNMEKALNKVGIKTYTINKEFGRAHEDFILSQYYIDECGPEVLEYCHFFSDGTIDYDLDPDPNESPESWFEWHYKNDNSVIITGMKPEHQIFKKEPLNINDIRPHDVLIWIDSSSSMHDKINIIKDEINKLLDSLSAINPENKIALITSISDVDKFNLSGIDNISSKYTYFDNVLITDFTNNKNDLSGFTNFIHVDGEYPNDGAVGHKHHGTNIDDQIYIGEDPTIILDSFKNNNFNINWRNTAKSIDNKSYETVVKTIILITDEMYHPYSNEKNIINNGIYGNVNLNKGKYSRVDFIKTLSHNNAEVMLMLLDDLNDSNNKNIYYDEFVNLLYTAINGYCAGYISSLDNVSNILNEMFKTKFYNQKTIRYYYKEPIGKYIDFKPTDPISTIPEFNIIVPHRIHNGVVTEISALSFKENVAFKWFKTQKYLTDIGQDIFDEKCDDLETIEFRDPNLTSGYIDNNHVLDSVKNLPNLSVIYFNPNDPNNLIKDKHVAFQLSSYDIYSIQDLSSIEECCIELRKHGYHRAFDECPNDPSYVDGINTFDVTEESIAEFLKIYVNYMVEPNGEITLYFNYNNFFNSPYMYRTSKGEFRTILLPKTYCSIKSGEVGELDIVFQFKYFNDVGFLCGLNTITVLSYKIWNVSDDKPKFIIVKKWEINNNIYNPSIINKMPVYLNVTSQTITSAETQDSIDINNEIVLFPLSSSVEIGVTSEIPINKTTCLIAYETGEYQEFKMLKNDKMTKFNDSYGIVNLEFNGDSLPLEFNLLPGASFANESSLIFPIKILSANAIDIKGNPQKNIIISNGSITYQFNNNIESRLSGMYLAKEHIDFGGFVLDETGKNLIRMYNAKSDFPSIIKSKIKIATVNSEDQDKDLLNINTENNAPMLIELKDRKN